MTIPTVQCGTHGEQPRTFVCRHIVEAAQAGEPNGFWWARSPDGVLDAVCDACNALSQDEFDALGSANIVELCMGCFEDAAALNGVDID